ncbi:MAG: RNA methyltransferase [Bacteroidetes bacterium]|nr:RNA methyltransferase [Bacteroidota bacterium]
MAERITSLQNPRIKQVVLLQQKSKERKKLNLIIVEGSREIRWAIEADIEPVSLFYCGDLLNSESREVLSMIKNDQLIEVSNEVFSKIAYREGSDGLILMASAIHKTLADIKLSASPLVIILEGVEKPGNLGAILRTADASRADVVIVCDPLTDIYNPNVIRSSIGCVFTKQVVSCSTEQALEWLKKNHIKSIAAALTATENYHKIDMTVPCAIVMGTEADGLTKKWLDSVDQSVIIPMLGKHDSLNVATATAIIAFEALRQRDFYA